MGEQSFTQMPLIVRPTPKSYITNLLRLKFADAHLSYVTSKRCKIEVAVFLNLTFFFKYVRITENISYHKPNRVIQRIQREASAYIASPVCAKGIFKGELAAYSTECVVWMQGGKTCTDAPTA